MNASKWKLYVFTVTIPDEKSIRCKMNKLYFLTLIFILSFLSRITFHTVTIKVVNKTSIACLKMFNNDCNGVRYYL